MKMMTFTEWLEKDKIISIMRGCGTRKIERIPERIRIKKAWNYLLEKYDNFDTSTLPTDKLTELEQLLKYLKSVIIQGKTPSQIDICKAHDILDETTWFKPKEKLNKQEEKILKDFVCIICHKKFTEKELLTYNYLPKYKLSKTELNGKQQIIPYLYEIQHKYH